MAITRINEFVAAPGKAVALREFLTSVVAAIEDAPGCLGCEMFVGHEDDARLAIVETWESVAAHQAAATRIPPEKLAEVRPLLSEPPKGRSYDKA